MGTYLGQNFLIDTKIQNYIAEKVKKIYDLQKLEFLLEIGPGKGAITKKIKNISDQFFVVERDESLYEILSQILSKGQIISGDILDPEIDFQLKQKNINPKKTLIVGNLPYYITSPIFRKFFGNGDSSFFGGFFMIQDEVGKKIQTLATKKSYLWRLLNYSYDVIYHKTVGSKCFNPPPKVTSCLIELKKNTEKRNISFENLVNFLDLVSPFSRKTLSAISKLLKKQKNIGLIIPDNLLGKRLEELSWTDLEKISLILKSSN